jgi:hypothetical protein
MSVIDIKDLHFLDVIVRDGQAELEVLARTFGDFEWPSVINFDTAMWYFSGQIAMNQEEGLQYGGKALYKPSAFGLLPQVNDPIKTEVKTEHKYFVVGATWGTGENQRDILPWFLKRGYWQNGYERELNKYNTVVDKMKAGDRIAVKRLRGQKQSFMDILALGIITDVDSDGVTVYVKWVMQFKPDTRIVGLHGCVGTAFGPYVSSKLSVINRNWLHSVFSI